jgi:uncharacterized NAD-dependent epimerase/dehydratase family protein
VLAIALNHEHLPENEREAARRRVEEETGVPAIYPLSEGERLQPLVADYVAAERATRAARGAKANA